MGSPRYSQTKGHEMVVVVVVVAAAATAAVNI